MTRPIARPSRRGASLAVVLAALAPSGCARDRGQITPTTLGTDLQAMPRGRMIPQPFPGSSLARPAPAPPRGPPPTPTRSRPPPRSPRRP